MLGKAAYLSVVFLAPTAAHAHHSHAMYDPAQTLTLTGEVADYQWINPHVWLYLEVASETGQPLLWILETGSPTTVERRGWREDSVSPGDIVTVTFRRLRDGSRGGLLGYVELSNGKILYDPY